jgi:hypothetical protein
VKAGGDLGTKDGFGLCCGSATVWLETSTKEEAEEWILALKMVLHQPVTETPEKEEKKQAEKAEEKEKSPAEGDVAKATASKEPEKKEEETKAEPTSTTAADDEWLEYTTPEGDVYYYNPKTNQSSWEKPN